MTARRLGLIFAVILPAALVAGVWLLPGMLDWDRYRGNIAVLASAVLGQPVSIGGRVSLTLLPEPVLTASDVSVAGRDGGATVTARELRLRVALMPLLSGTVAARELVLRRPDIRIRWPLAPGGLSFHRPPWLDSVSARIEGGTLSVGDVHFTDIDATFTAGGDSGGASAAGTARRNGLGWRFSARATGAGPDDVAGLDIALDGQGPVQGFGAAFSGQLAADGTLSGRLEARGPDLSQLLPAPAVAFHASGRLTLAAGLAAADELEAEIGGSPVHGAVTLRVNPAPRLDLALAASRLDLDAWLPVLLRQGGFPCPVGLDLSAEAVQLSGGLLRRLRAAFDFSPDGQVTVREASAVLPGEAALRLDGQVVRVALRQGGPQARFTGHASLAASDLRSTLRWLEAAGLKPLSGLPPEVLRSLEVSAAVIVDPGRLALHDLEGRVDGSAVVGELGLGLGPRLAIAARLAVEPLLLDPWLNGHWPALGEIADLLAPVDADLQVTAPSATWRGEPIEALDLDMTTLDGRVTLRRLTFAVRGVLAQLSGNIGDGGRVADGRLDINAADAAPLAELLPPALFSPALWHGPASIQVEASGPPQALGMRIGVDLADGRLEAQPVLDLPARSWSGAVTLRHPGAKRLLTLLGLSRPGWLGDGSLSLVAQLAGGPGRMAADTFELRAGALHAGGQLLLEDGPGAPPRLSGHIAAETLPLPLPSVRSPEPLPLEPLRGWQVSLKVEAAHLLSGTGPLLDGASATLSLANGIIRLDQLTGTLWGGRLTGAAAIDTTLEPPAAQFRATLAGAALVEPLTGLPLDLAAGRLEGGVDLTASGHSPAAMLSTLDGTLRIAARDGAVSGFDLSQADEALAKEPADDGVLPALSDGNTGFERLDVAGRLRDGQFVVGEAAMSGPSGSARFSGSVDIAGAAIDLHAALHPNLPDAPELGVRITGPWASARRIVELADFTRWRALQAAK